MLKLALLGVAQQHTRERKRYSQDDRIEVNEMIRFEYRFQLFSDKVIRLQMMSIEEIHNKY